MESNRKDSEGVRDQMTALCLRMYKEKMDGALGIKLTSPADLQEFHTNLCTSLQVMLKQTLGTNGNNIWPWVHKVLNLHYEMYGHRNRVKLKVLGEHDQKLAKESMEVFSRVFNANRRKYAKAVAFDHMTYHEAFCELRSVALSAAVKNYLASCYSPEHNLRGLVDENFAHFNGQFREVCKALAEGAKISEPEVDLGGGIRRKNALRKDSRSTRPVSSSISSHSDPTGSETATDDSGFADSSEQRISDDDGNGSASRNSPSRSVIESLSTDDEEKLRSQLLQLVSNFGGLKSVESELATELAGVQIGTHGGLRRSVGTPRRPHRMLSAIQRSRSVCEMDPIANIQGWFLTENIHEDFLAQSDDTSSESSAVIFVTNEQDWQRSDWSRSCGNLPRLSFRSSDGSMGSLNAIPEAKTLFVTTRKDSYKGSNNLSRSSSVMSLGPNGNTCMLSRESKLAVSNLELHLDSTDGTSCDGDLINYRTASMHNVYPSRAPRPKPRLKLQRQTNVECEEKSPSEPTKIIPSLLLTPPILSNSLENVNFNTSFADHLVSMKQANTLNSNETDILEVSTRKLVILIGSDQVYVRSICVNENGVATGGPPATVDTVTKFGDETFQILQLLNGKCDQDDPSHSPEDVIAEFLQTIYSDFGLGAGKNLILYPGSYTIFQIRRLKVAAYLAGFPTVELVSIPAVAAYACGTNYGQFLSVHFTSRDFHASVLEVEPDQVVVRAAKGSAELQFPNRFLPNHKDAISGSRERRASRHYDEIFLKTLNEARTHVGRIESACVIFQKDLIHLTGMVKETLVYHNVTSLTEEELLISERIGDSFTFTEITEEFRVSFEDEVVGKFSIPGRRSVDSEASSLCEIVLENVKMGMNNIMIGAKQEVEVYQFHFEQDFQVPVKVVVKPYPVVMYRILVHDSKGNRIAVNNLTFSSLTRFGIVSLSKPTFV